VAVAAVVVTTAAAVDLGLAAAADLRMQMEVSRVVQRILRVIEPVMAMSHSHIPMFSE
jgi:hypothetical protein